MVKECLPPGAEIVEAPEWENRLYPTIFLVAVSMNN